MEFLELAKKRYSVRAYDDRPVEKEKLDKILEAAHVAPTAANLQPVKLIAVQKKEQLNKLAKAANIYHAPLAIIVCADHEKAWVRPFDQKLGLGTVWVCYFKPDIVKKEFHLPDNLEPVNILVIGYGKEPEASSERHTATRIAINDLVSYDYL